MLLLKTVDLRKYFGGLKAVDRVNIQINGGTIHGIIGPNGAGKTTLFNLITGHLKPTGGAVYFKERRIDGLKPHQIAKLGIARTFQIVRPFTHLTVVENVTAAYGHLYYDTIKLFTRYDTASIKQEVFKILEFVGLREKSHLLAGALPIGLQRRLEIARALALDPSLLLLDEPAAGLTEEEIGQLKEIIRKLVNQGVTIVLVEHRMKFVMDICDLISVLDRGQIIAEGRPEEVVNNLRVIEAYLGAPIGGRENVMG